MTTSKAGRSRDPEAAALFVDFTGSPAWATESLLSPWSKRRPPIATPWGQSLPVVRFGLDPENARFLWVGMTGSAPSGDNGEGAGPGRRKRRWRALSWLASLTGAGRLIVLEKVVAANRVLEPGDIVVPSYFRLSSGSGEAGFTGLSVSRGLYGEILAALHGKPAGGRLFRRGTYLSVDHPPGTGTGLGCSSEGGVDIMGREMGSELAMLLDKVQVAAVCLVDRRLEVETGEKTAAPPGEPIIAAAGLIAARITLSEA